MSDADRLRFALSKLPSADWESFEHLASAYLAGDFDDLRTLTGVGDEGRDAILFPAANPQIVLQYSVEKDWAKKIRKTIARLREAEHEFSGLVYVTNQEIGSAANDLKTELSKEGVLLDVRDLSYFVDRVDKSQAHRNAAAALSERVITPLLPGSEVLRNSSVGDPDLRAGLLYLELQLHDAEGGRNISRLSHDAVVLTVLRDTTPENQMSRAEIVAHATRLLGSDAPLVGESVDGALERLRRRERIVYTRGTNSYSLHFTERQRREEDAIALLTQREEVRAQLRVLAQAAADDLQVPLLDEAVDAVVDAVEAVFERTLEIQGNAFADAVKRQAATALKSDLAQIVRDLVVERSGDLRVARVSTDALVALIIEIATNAVLVGGALQVHLRDLADAYTLLAFIQQAPDVQRAVGHFFSRGRLLLDTTVLLPCFAEDLLDPEDQRHTNLLRGASEAGMTLCVTDGVVNEIDSHLLLSLTCSRTAPSQWEGSIPRVYADWFAIANGGDFAGFVRRFRGREGEPNIRLFLEQALGIEVVDLDPVVARMDKDLRYRLSELWRPRKALRIEGSELERDLLLRHDIEMYMGVLGWRDKEKADLFGYEAWWVTSDGTAFRLADLAADEGIQLKSNPVMSPNFLANLLSIGPARSRLTRRIRDQLPVALDIQRNGWEVSELSAVADRIRAECAGEPEWLIRGRIRDAMMEIKTRPGVLDPSTPVVEVASAVPDVVPPAGPEDPQPA